MPAAANPAAFKVQQLPTGVSAADIELQLAQTQCGECGFNGCAPYSQAIAAGAAPITNCKPGGQRVAATLAKLLELPLPQVANAAPQLAHINEAACIGCTLCIQACPTDAIIGAPKMAHTIMAQDCTGCGLCVAPCPVDCIELIPGGAPDNAARAAEVRALVQAKNARKIASKDTQIDAQQSWQKDRSAAAPTLDVELSADAAARIAAARARAQQKWAEKQPATPKLLQKTAYNKSTPQAETGKS